MWKKVAKDPSGKEINALAQHIQNLLTPSTPLFFNTLYDPYREGADFVRGYPFSLREGVSTAISHGLWLNIPDYDAPTQLVKPCECSTRLSLLSLLVRLAVASFIGLSLLKYDLFLFLFFWLSVLSHKMFCFNTFGNMLFCIFLNQLSTWCYSFPWLPNRGEDYYPILQFCREWFLSIIGIDIF